jgi:toxin secretion/phage lysis holin
MMKEMFCAFSCIVGGAAIALFDRWDSVVAVLIIFMAIDFVTGLIVATVFKNSKHGKGGLESKVCWKGLSKKGVTLLICLMSAYFDLLLGTNFILTAVAIGFIVSESISIIENAGLMGIHIPTQLKDAIAILKSKSKDGEK